MQYIKCSVSTVCIGSAASGAAILLAAGAKGKRFSLPNSQIMLHQVAMRGIGGQASEIRITAKHIMNLKERVNRILANHTGQSVTKIEKDTDRDFYLSAKEAKEYGIIDKVISGKIK